jgi:hypothetical protein
LHRLILDVAEDKLFVYNFIRDVLLSIYESGESSARLNRVPETNGMAGLPAAGYTSEGNRVHMEGRSLPSTHRTAIRPHDQVVPIAAASAHYRTRS